MTSNLDTAVTDETPAQEFSRLVIAYNEGDEESSERQEAWNLIADFALEHCDTILAALSARVPALPQVGGEAEPVAMKPLRFCGYCKSWNRKPCGDGCVWQPDMPTELPEATAPLAVDQAMREALETQAWECWGWPAWLHSVVDQTDEVSTRLDMSSEQALAYAALLSAALKQEESK